MWARSLLWCSWWETKSWSLERHRKICLGDRDLGVTGNLGHVILFRDIICQNSSLTKLGDCDRSRSIVSFPQMMGGRKCLYVVQWAFMGPNYVIYVLDIMDECMHVWFGELACSRAKLYMVGGNEMSVSFSGVSCRMTSQCTWGMDLGSGVWL